VLSPPFCLIAKSTFLAVLAQPNDNEQQDGSGCAVEPHAHHGAVERLAAVGSDYLPTVARPHHGIGPPPHRRRASAHCPLMNELHRKPRFVNLVEIISTALAWRESSREELDVRCRGTFAAVEQFFRDPRRAYGLRRTAFAQAPRGDLGRKKAKHARRRSLEGIA
jgi:hypothetical protein